MLMVAQCFLIIKDDHDKMMVVGAINCVLSFIIIGLSVSCLGPKT